MATITRIPRALLGLALALQVAGALGCATTTPATQAERDRKVRSHYELAVNHLKEGRTGIAIRELLAAEALDPQDPWIQLALAESYRLKAHNAEAEHHLKRALAIRPDLHAAELNLSALYIQTERYEDAIEASDELLADATFAAPWKALTNKGYALYRLQRRAEARETLGQALEYHEHFWPARLDLAILDQDEGRHLEALEGLEAVLGQKPGAIARAEVNYRMATIYISLGNRAKAVHHLTVATETRPSGEWGKRSADYLKRLR
jgi:type IV pilus assembly protein PilF